LSNSELIFSAGISIFGCAEVEMASKMNKIPWKIDRMVRFVG
jgi:hypothetical protein